MNLKKYYNKLLKILKGKYRLNIKISEKTPNCIKFLEEPSINLYDLIEFEKGFFEIQDEGSQFISNKININEKELILDYCSGSGGKSLAIAPKLNNSGQIYLHDIRESSIQKAKNRFKRSGFTNVQFHKNENKLEKFKGKFDWIILDVPCSGTGTLRRNPDLKYKINNNILKYLTELQYSIFKKSLRFLKKDGKLIYITCSILNCENEKQISKFIKEKKGLKVIEQSSIPYKMGESDAFFYSIIQNN